MKDPIIEILDKTRCINCNHYDHVCICALMDQYNQLERSKREDFELLADHFLESDTSDRGGNWETENGYLLGIENFSKWLNQRCGTLNSRETD